MLFSIARSTLLNGWMCLEACRTGGRNSLQANSEIVSRRVDGQVFNAPNVNMSVLTDKLPLTPAVSENDGAVVMMYQGKP